MARPEPARALSRGRLRLASAWSTSTPAPCTARSRLRRCVEASTRRMWIGSQSSPRTSTLEVGEHGVLVDGIDATTEIRSHEVTTAVSAVAANSAVRAELVQRQRAWANQRGGGVLEGRDIGIGRVPRRRAEAVPHGVAAGSCRASRGRTGGDVEEIAAAIERSDRSDTTRSRRPVGRGRRLDRRGHHRAERSTRCSTHRDYSWSGHDDEVSIDTHRQQGSAIGSRTSRSVASSRRSAALVPNRPSTAGRTCPPTGRSCSRRHIAASSTHRSPRASRTAACGSWAPTSTGRTGRSADC